MVQPIGYMKKNLVVLATSNGVLTANSLLGYVSTKAKSNNSHSMFTITLTMLHTPTNILKLAKLILLYLSMFTIQKTAIPSK